MVRSIQIVGDPAGFGVTFNTFHRPLAIRNLRPSRDTCETCHWSEQFQPDKLKVIRRYEEDEHNTEKTTVLLVHTGTGIHKAHVGKNIEYIAAEVTVTLSNRVSFH
jgi:hypothetical protein